MAQTVTEVQQTEEQQSVFSGKLPGLARVFRVQLWLALIASLISVLVMAWGLFQLLSHGYGFRYMRGGDILILLLSAGIIVAFLALSWRALGAMQRRVPETPARCRQLLVFNMLIVAIMLVLLAGVLLLSDDYTGNFAEYVQSSLMTLVLCEAWRRYFARSPRVREAFGLPLEEVDDTPAEINFFRILCWAALIYGVWPAIDVFSEIMDTMSLSQAHSEYPFLMPRLYMRLAACLILPFMGLYALSAYENRRGKMFTALAMWLGFWIISYLLRVLEAVARSNGQNPVMPDFLNPWIIFGLVYWWYFAVSEKGKAWLAEQPESWKM